MKRLRFVLTSAPRVNPKFKRTPDALVSFAPMDALADGLGGLSELETKPFSEVASGSYNYFENGDVLLAKVTPCFENGKKAIAGDLENGAGFATSEVLVFRPDSEWIDSRYLRYLFCSEDFRHKAIASMTGAGGLRRVSERAVLDYPLRITDLAIQRQIADFLDRETARTDLLIEKKQRLVTLLGEKWEARIQSEISGKNAPEPRMSENPFFAAVPSGWRLQSLKSIFNMVSGFAFKSEFFRKGETELPILVTPGSFNPNGGLYPTRELDVGYLGEFDNRFLLERGDMVVAMTDLSYRKLILGRCEFVDRDGMLLNQRIAKIVNLNHDVRPAFLRYAMNARSSREQVSLSAVGATVFHSSAEKIRSTHILVPPIAVQDRIVDELDKQDRLHRSLVNGVNLSIDRLKEYRSALITAAVTGQIDVATYAKSGTPDRHLDAIQEEMGA